MRLADFVWEQVRKGHNLGVAEGSKGTFGFTALLEMIEGKEGYTGQS